MPLVIWLASLFSSLATYIAGYLGKKFSVVAAAIVSFTSVLLTFKLAIDAILNGLQSVAPTGIVLLGIQLLPDNTASCIAAISSAYVAAQVYVYWRNIIAFRLTN